MVSREHHLRRPAVKFNIDERPAFERLHDTAPRRMRLGPWLAISPSRISRRAASALRVATSSAHKAYLGTPKRAGSIALGGVAPSLDCEGRRALVALVGPPVV
jgi:hypothetical protein